jgi:RNA-dependent RNA polymerase
MDGEDVGVASREHLIVGLDRAWTAWCFAARYRKNWGAQSFGLVALALIFACIDNIETRV